MSNIPLFLKNIYHSGILPNISDENVLYSGLIILALVCISVDGILGFVSIWGLATLFKVITFFIDFYKNYAKKLLGKRNRKVIDRVKWIMVTGSTDGIGKAMASICNSYGKGVVIVGRDPNKVNSVISELKYQSVDKAASVLVNLDKIDSISSCVDFWKTEFERLPEIDVLMNNAGVSLKGSVRTSSYSELITVLNVNLITPLIVTSVFLERSKRANTMDSKFVELTSSGMSLLPVPYSKLYPFSKWLITDAIKYYAHSAQSHGYRNLFTYVLVGEVLTKLSSGVANFENLTQEELLKMTNTRYITSSQAAESILYQGLGDLETSGHPKHYLITLFVKMMKRVYEKGAVDILTQKRLKYLRENGFVI